MPLLVHGIIEADAVEASASAVSSDPELAVVTCRALAAVVRDVEAAEVLPSRANLLEHTAVLERLAEVTTVLPMRFGVVAEDRSALTEGYLDSQHDELLATLGRLRGHVELRLRGRYDEEALLREVVADDPAVARLRGRAGMDARMQLGEHVVAGIEARRERDLERVGDALAPHVAGMVAGSVAEPLDAFSLSLLVDRDAMAPFDRALDELGRTMAPALALELVGPVPPFSFTVAEGASA